MGRTEEEAADKWRLYQQHASLDGILAHYSLPVDLTAFPRDITVAEALRRAEVLPSEVPFLPLERTVGQALDFIKGSRDDRFFVAGTPKVVADQIEKWLDEDGLDGINLRQYHSFDTARDFAELVVPELVQEVATPAALARAVLDWLHDPARRERTAARFSDMHHSLKRDTARLVADSIFEVAQ